MNIAHNFMAPVTVVVTACNRPDLLERTLDSFLIFNTYRHIAKVIVVEDSGIPGINARLKEKYAPTVTWLDNENRLGQIAAIDRAYALVETPYIFHCEEDWEFYEEGFVEASMAILEADRKAIMVWLRAHADTMGHPLDEKFLRVARTSCGHEVRYRMMALDYGCWHGFSFNPGLRRLEDYRIFFPGGFSRRFCFVRWRPYEAEAQIGEVYKLFGYYAAILDVPTGFVRHIGWGRHILYRSEITETQLKLRDAGTQMKLAIKNVGDEDVFRSCVNAYISAARSVTIIMEKESAIYPELLAWYKAQMAELGKLPIMKFFNERRVHTIHRGNVKPVSHRMPIWDMVVDGKKLEPGTGTIMVWTFDNVNEYMLDKSGNVFNLCGQYFLILRTLVHEWLSQKALIEKG